MRLIPNYSFQFQLQASSVDAANGIIKGATVARLGVQAVGKFLYLDRAGNRVNDPKDSARKFQVATDETTLTSMMEAISKVGGRLKVRSDHDDTIGARGGFAVNFTREPGRIACDLCLNKSYRDREIVLETAQTDPTNIGLSVDIDPTFEIEGDTAKLRVANIKAVDIVDRGAITPGGLFLSVNNKDNIETEIHPKIIMADKDKTTEPTLAEFMATMTQGFASLQTTVKSCVDGLAATDKKVADLATSFTASVNETKESIGKLSITRAQDNAALGLSGDAAGKLAQGGGSGTDDKKKKVNPTDAYFAAVDETIKEGAGKVSRLDAYAIVNAKRPDLYEAYGVHQGRFKASGRFDSVT